MLQKKIKWDVLRLVLKDVAIDILNVSKFIATFLLIVIIILLPFIINDMNEKYTWIGFIPSIGFILSILYWEIEERYERKIEVLKDDKDLENNRSKNTDETED